MVTYKNPWFKGVGKPEYGPEVYTTSVKPFEYRGYKVYERIIGRVWDVVKDNVCVTQMAGPDGARRAIDKLVEA